MKSSTFRANWLQLRASIQLGVENNLCMIGEYFMDSMYRGEDIQIRKGTVGRKIAAKSMYATGRKFRPFIWQANVSQRSAHQLSILSQETVFVEGFWFLYFRTLETHIANESETLWRIQPSCCLCYDCMCSADSSNKLSSNPSNPRDQRPSKLVKQSQGSASANKSVAQFKGRNLRTWAQNNHKKNTLTGPCSLRCFQSNIIKHPLFQFLFLQRHTTSIHKCSDVLCILCISPRHARSHCELQPCSCNISRGEICGASRSKYVRKAPARASPPAVSC